MLRGSRTGVSMLYLLIDYKHVCYNDNSGGSQSRHQLLVNSIRRHFLYLCITPETSLLQANTSSVIEAPRPSKPPVKPTLAI